MSWDVVVGLEIHAQLATRTKIFSGAPTAFGAEPNRQACAVDLGLPGVLPVLNARAVHMALKFGLAIGAHLNLRSVFARKNYFYPDLPKGYQISQYEHPIVEGGGVPARLDDGREVRVELIRAHLEEDAGKSLHDAFHGATAIDLNRAGTPLIEVVTTPCLHSAAEAAAAMRAVHRLVTWLGICDGNLQEGSFRCDANVSVRRPGGPLGTRREIKNLNSFRFLQQAIDYEIKWQIETLEDGGRIEQATVLFNPDTGETRAMRSKEDAHDYRYFPDPDLLPLEITPAWIDEVRAALPELPAALKDRCQREYGLSAYDAATLTAQRETAQFFLDTVAVAGPELAKTAANWIMGEVSARLNREELEIAASPVSPAQLAGLLQRIADNTVSNAIARKVFEALWSGEGASADQVIEAQGLKQITDSGAVEAMVDAVLAANPKSVEEFRAGKEKAFNALVGQVMKAAKGKANPQQVTDLLRAKLVG